MDVGWSCRMESAVTRIQPPELESAMGPSQLQLVSSRRNSSHPQDRISRNSYPAARTRVSWRMESAATRIQPPELEPEFWWLDTSCSWLKFRQLDTSYGWLQPTADSSSGSWIRVAADSILQLTLVLAAGYEFRLILSCGWLEFRRLDTSCSWLCPTADLSSGGWILLLLLLLSLYFLLTFT